jgi:hypothetical protein
LNNARPDPRQSKVEAARAVLASRFGYASEAVLQLQARQLVSSAEAAEFVTHRAADARAVKKLELALEKARAAVQELSRPTQEALNDRLFVAGCRLALDQIAEISDQVRDAVPETPFSNRENVAAIFPVDDARSIWAGHKGEHAPAACLNPASPFAGFLADLFEVLGVGSGPRSAFQAWCRYRESSLF